MRNGTADRLAACAVCDGQVTAIVRRQHRSRELCELLDRLDRQTPLGETIQLSVDPASLHRSAEVAVWLAYRPWRPLACHWQLTHASWLSFVEAGFAILYTPCLTRAELADVDAAEHALSDSIAADNTHQAHPFT